MGPCVNPVRPISGSSRRRRRRRRRGGGGGGHPHTESLLCSFPDLLAPPSGSWSGLHGPNVPLLHNLQHNQLL
ncbi:hypothetical protein Q5P01_005798 [Channa striata]|uniref:Uncharacterized protein n=1 Tax=Channa striata TaxID=64152 RepID=A0AA88SYV4_CHASR|nr:hypothetical protein Q5P01_005798 [Channa striata]